MKKKTSVTPCKGGHNAQIKRAKAAKNYDTRDTNPKVEKDGYLGVDSLDKARRRKMK